MLSYGHAFPTLVATTLCTAPTNKMTHPDTANFLSKLLSRREREGASVLLWELRDALKEKRSSGKLLSEVERKVLALCLVQNCDGIAELIPAERESIAIAALFASEHGFAETARLLTDVLADKPAAGPVSLVAKTLGVEKSIPLPYQRWGATDLALTFADEALNDAILDFVVANFAAFELNAPKEVAEREAKAGTVEALAASASAVALIERLLTHRQPVIRAQIREDERRGGKTDWIEVPVVHRAGGPAPANEVAALRKKLGSPADALLDIYAKFNGLELFATTAETALYFVSVEQWSEHHDAVMSWATEVTWGGEPEEIPDYLHTAIAFGYTPGDSERWLLITEGEHAGKIMLSDTDVIDDSPRFESIGHFVATLVLDMARVIGNGGYISYSKDASTHGDYYPETYVYAS
ncbi:MAG: hypothetical protein ABL931_06435 [Usitatibacteraceae bacterium]